VYDASSLPKFHSLLNGTNTIPTMTESTISSKLFTHAVSRIENWKAPGLIKTFHLFVYMTILTHYRFIKVLLLNGRTTLIMKNSKLGHNYRTITCLLTLWKLFSFMLSELIYSQFIFCRTKQLSKVCMELI